MLRDGVSRCQRDISFFGGRSEVRNVTAVEPIENVFVELIVADSIKQIDKALIRLPIDMFEFNRDVLGFLQCLARKEIRSGVVFLQHRPIFVFDDRRKLVQVADHQQLNATERQACFPVGSQDLIDGIEHIGSNHTDFVDDQ